MTDEGKITPSRFGDEEFKRITQDASKGIILGGKKPQPPPPAGIVMQAPDGAFHYRWLASGKTYCLAKMAAQYEQLLKAVNDLEYMKKRVLELEAEAKEEDDEGKEAEEGEEQDGDEDREQEQEEDTQESGDGTVLGD